MKKIIVSALVACVALGYAFSASAAEPAAEARIVNLWKCELNDKKTIDDVHAANGKWVKYVNAHVKGGDIHSYVLQTVVGKSRTFLYADSYPNMASWSAATDIDNDEMTAIGAELDAVAKCSSNTLHKSKAS